MALRKIRIQEGQSHLDLAVQEYGDIEHLFTIFASNPSIDINTDLVALQELNIDTADQGNEEIKSAFKRVEFITNNKDDKYTPEIGTKLFQDGNNVLFQDGNLYNFN